MSESIEAKLFPNFEAFDSLTFRQVGERDLPVLLQIQSQLTPTTFELAKESLKRIERYPNYAVYLAYDGGIPVGTFAIIAVDNLGLMGCPFAVIENVVVDQKLRGKSYGRVMMKFAEKISREARCYKVILGSNMKLERAHRFYESLGFSVQGIVYYLDLGLPVDRARILEEANRSPSTSAPNYRTP